MANWYNTQFIANDKDIIRLIEDGVTRDFSYNKQDCTGYCKLRNGLNALDIDAIKSTAKNNNSTFHIETSDIMTDTFICWAYMRGEEVSYNNTKLSKHTEDLNKAYDMLYSIDENIQHIDNQ